jgi:hypothetical protein
MFGKTLKFAHVGKSRVSQKRLSRNCTERFVDGEIVSTFCVSDDSACGCGEEKFLAENPITVKRKSIHPRITSTVGM